MQKIFTFLSSLFLFCQSVLCAYSPMNKAPTLHICTVASHKTKGLEQLLTSCKHYGVKIDVLGLGLPYRGMIEKLIYVQKYIQTLPDKDIVMFVDAYDVLILDTPESILKKFLKMDAPFVISVERFCFPYGDRASEFPKGPTTFRYINSGSYIGYVRYIKDLFKELSPFNIGDDDQGLFMRHYFQYPKKYTFDAKCVLFLPLAGVIEGELQIDRESVQVKCNETQTTPCVIHGNGGSRPLYQVIYDKLFKDRK